eukprot:g22175.t1
MLKPYCDRERELEKQILVTAIQSEESNPDDVNFDVPQKRLNNEEVLKEWEFVKAEVMFLWHNIRHRWTTLRNVKIKAVEEFPRPSSKKEVLQFLGLRELYRKFVPNISSVVALLTILFKKNMKFQWTEPCQEAFENTKPLLNTVPVLATPNFLKPFVVAINTSDVGVGAVLLQEDAR